MLVSSVVAVLVGAVDAAVDDNPIRYAEGLYSNRRGFPMESVILVAERLVLREREDDDDEEEDLFLLLLLLLDAGTPAPPPPAVSWRFIAWLRCLLPSMR